MPKVIRPQRTETLKSLSDHLRRLLARGVDPRSKVFIQDPDGALTHPTMIYYGDESPDYRPFLVLEDWTPEQLEANALHCDRLDAKA